MQLYRTLVWDSINDRYYVVVRYPNYPVCAQFLWIDKDDYQCLRVWTERMNWTEHETR